MLQKSSYTIFQPYLIRFDTDFNADEISQNWHKCDDLVRPIIKIIIIMCS